MMKNLFIILLMVGAIVSCEKVDDELYKPFLETEEGKIVNPDGSDEERKEKKEEDSYAVNYGKWYLRDYDISSAVFSNPDLSFVTWGEYLSFDTGDKNTLYWEKRLQGTAKQAKIFNYTLSGTTLRLSSSWSGESYIFYIVRHNENELCLRCSDGIYRYYTR